MATVDLDTMNLNELKKHQKDVEKAIRDLEKLRKKEALAAAEAIAREKGYSLAELMGDATKTAKKEQVNPPKYLHPENSELTWSGRGRQPAWIKEGLEAGKSLDDFLIATN